MPKHEDKLLQSELGSTVLINLASARRELNQRSRPAIFNSSQSFENLPAYLYRVFHDASATTFDPEVGFYSKGLLHNPSFRGIKDGFISHMDWGCTAPSPFISVFSSDDEAVRWAFSLLGMRSLRPANLRIAKIDSNLLSEHCLGIFNTKELANSLSKEKQALIHHDRSKIGFQYICLWFIPFFAIEKIIDVDVQTNPHSPAMFDTYDYPRILSKLRDEGAELSLFY